MLGTHPEDPEARGRGSSHRLCALRGHRGYGGTALDLGHCALFCHMCRDYVYDTDFDSIVRDERRRLYDDVVALQRTAFPERRRTHQANAQQECRS